MVEKRIEEIKPSRPGAQPILQDVGPNDRKSNKKQGYLRATVPKVIKRLSSSVHDSQ